MRTYTIVYSTQDDQVLVDTRQAANEPEAVSSFERDSRTSDILHVIEHHTPKVTVVLDGDMVQAAYADSAVEILHCYADKEAVGNALDNGLSLMPGSRHCINYPEKANHAYPFGWVDVDYNPGAASFDHSYARDESLINEFTEAVREELES